MLAFLISTRKTPMKIVGFAVVMVFTGICFAQDNDAARISAAQARLAAKGSPATKPTAPDPVTMHTKKRASSDGIEYPPASDVAFKANLPLVSNKLGALPESMGMVLNAKKSHQQIESLGIKNFDCDWFVRAFAGADLAGFDLSDGRVTRIVVIWNKPAVTTVQMEKVMNDFRSYAGIKLPADPDTFKTKGKFPLNAHVTRYWNPNRIEVALDGADWYLFAHPNTPEAIADAIREKRPIKDMTLEQARATFGKPTSQSDGYELVLTWDQKQLMAQHGQIFSSAEDLVGSIGASTPQYHVVRSIQIHFKDGVATNVFDSKE